MCPWKMMNIKHRCKLPKEDLVAQLVPGKGCGTRLRREYHKMFMINSSDPRTRIYCDSLQSIRMQQIEHVTKYPFYIHPMSKFRKFWDIFLILIDLSLLIYLPINKMYCYYPVGHINVNCHYALWIILLVPCLIDIFVNFLTVFYSSKKKYFVYSYRQISINYAKTRLVLDVLSIAPYFWPVKIQPFEPIYVANVYMVLSFFRIVHLIYYINNWSQVVHSYIISLKIMKLLLFTFVPLHYLTCWIIIETTFEMQFDEHGVPTSKSWITMNGLWNSSRLHIYAMALYKSSCLMGGSDGLAMTSSPVEFHRSQHKMKIFNWILARINYAILIWYLISILQAVFMHRIRYRQLTQKIHYFSDSKLLSKRLTQRLYIYYNYYHGGIIFKEFEIFTSLLLKLKQDIIINTKIRYLLNLQFFNILPINILEAFCFFFKEHIYLKGDVINSGKKTESLMIIISGTAACYTSTGVEFLHLVDGDLSGELEFESDNKLFYTIVALEPCKIYCLYLKDFYAILSLVSQYSELLKQIQLQIENYVAFYKKIEIHFNQLINEGKQTNS